MAWWDEVRAGVDGVLAPEWSVREGTTVPETTDITLNNGAVCLDATYLYADMADSTGLAQRHHDWAVAKIIRCYLNAASRIIRHRGGKIRSFDGDRVMGIFIGDSKNSDAARTALNISWAVSEVINPALKAKWDSLTWKMDHGVGIATGRAMLVRGGVHGDNDIVSVGSAPNVAAKLSEIRGGGSLRCTKEVYDQINDQNKFGPEGQAMWTSDGYSTFGGKTFQIYGSGWQWGN